MNKHDVMKALALCAGVNGSGDCSECPYFGMPMCDKCLNEDAIALLGSEPDKPTYEMAVVYTKRDNLSKWFQANLNQLENMNYYDVYQRSRDHYAQEREVHLILLIRHEDIRIGSNIKSRCICRIKCPINPLPVRGEFECVSTSEMTKLLASMGWKYKEKIHYNLFR